MRHGGTDALVGDVEGSGHWRQHPLQVVSAARRQAIAHGGTTTTQDGHLTYWRERPGQLATPRHGGAGDPSSDAHVCLGGSPHPC